MYSYEMTSMQKFLHKTKNALLAFPLAIWSVVKAVPKTTWKIIKGIGQYFSEMFAMFINGSIFTKLGFVLMGFGSIAARSNSERNTIPYC